MNFKPKKNNVTKSLYVLLALCVLGIVLLSVYSLFTQDSGNGNLEKISNDSGSDNNNLKASADDELMKIFGQTEKPTEAMPKQSATEKKGTTEQDEPVITPPVIPDNDEYEDEAANIEEDIIFEDDIDEAMAPEIPSEPEEAVEVFSAPAVFSKPVFGVISKIHNPDNPEYSVSMNDYRTHLGIDIETEEAGEVKAVARGEVVSVYDDPLMGKTVMLRHAGGYESIYMNLMETIPETVKAGAMVEEGSVIGCVGNTALVETSDEFHLHFAMKKDGEYVNPLHYVEY